MRNTIIILVICLIAASCGKDKFTSAPQLKFKSVSPNTIRSDAFPDDPNMPYINMKVTDKEGDFGDTAYVHVKTFINGVPHYLLHSFKMPDISTIAEKNFEADIRINSHDLLRGDSTRTQRPRVDTLTFEIYLEDFAKNKSNVIVTTDPLFYVFP
jgi:hypothetical protein